MPYGFFHFSLHYYHRAAVFSVVVLYLPLYNERLLFTQYPWWKNFKDLFSELDSFQVAERALFLWNNDQIVNLIAHNRQVILPILLPVLEKNAQSHWNQAVLNLTLNVRKMFSEMDDVLFMSCHAQYREQVGNLSLVAQRRKEAWEQLENAARLQPITGNTAVLVTPLATSIAC